MRGVPLRQGECAAGHALTLGANTGNYKTGQGVCDVCGRIHPTGELMACSDCQVRILRLIRIHPSHDVIVTRITSIGRRRHDAIELKCARFEPIRRICLWAGGLLPRLLPGGDSEADGGGSGVAEPAAEGVREGLSRAAAMHLSCFSPTLLFCAWTMDKT